MASGSPSRSRIDQFFASKKRKAPSPHLKPGRNEKATWTVAEGSPSAKGNQKGTSDKLPEVAGAADVGSEEGESGLVHGPENSELKKFATDFLSLYCSEIPANVHSPSELKVNDHKRKASPLSLVASKKRHRIANPSHLEGSKSTCYGRKSFEDVPSTVVCKTGGNNTVVLQPTMNKCSNIPKPSLDIIECNTPGSLTAKIGFRAPKSAHGSSIYSPGEAFWNEAIQLADGLRYPAVNLAEESGVADQYHSKSSCSSRIENCDGKLTRREHECESVAKFNSLGGLTGKHEKGLEEKSPLPVKHFDFSFEDKKLDASVIIHVDMSDLKSTTQGSNINRCHNSQENKEKCGEQEIIPFSLATKRSVDSVDKENESMKYDIPIDGIMTAIGNCEGLCRAKTG